MGRTARVGRLQKIPIVIGMLCGAIAAPGAAAADPVGFVASLEGEVRVSSDDLSWQAARQDSPIAIGDRIQTAEGAKALILLVDDTLLHVDEDTELRVESFHVGAAATREKSILRQTRGRLRTVVGDAFGGPTRIEVHTPTAVVGIKGTDFETSDASLAGRSRWRCCLHAGGIDVDNGLGVASPRPGHCVHVTKDRAPGPEFPNPLEPLRGPERAAVPGEDFEELVAWRGPLPDSPELPDPGDLRVFDLDALAPLPAARSFFLPPFSLSVGPIP